jgi:hypothetical protein
MSFNDISAYPEKDFLRYWRKIVRSPFVTFAINDLERRYSQLKTQFSKVKSWNQFNKLMLKLIEILIKKTTEGFSSSGIVNLRSELEEQHGRVFLSNHRSTSLDPILSNYLFSKEFGEIAYNAVGDNIFQVPWLGDLIRLNRGFVVKRKVEDFDEKLNQANRLSEYIQGLLDKDKWVWIAHRNGRAKDGNDVTDSAVLAMLKMSSNDLGWGEYTDKYAITPLTLSWEKIPLDKEIMIEQLGKGKDKSADKDMKQIVKEINQAKKRIHIHIGSSVKAEKRNALVKGIDSEIQKGHRLWASNWYAYLQDESVSSENRSVIKQLVDLNEAKWLEEAASELAEDYQEPFFAMYAAPVKNVLKHTPDLEQAIKAQDKLFSR